MKIEDALYYVLVLVGNVISDMMDRNDPAEDKFLNRLIKELESAEDLMEDIGALIAFDYIDEEGHLK